MTSPDAPISFAAIDTDDLLALTAALVDIPSVSGSEAAIADAVERRLRERARSLAVYRSGNNVIAKTDAGRGRRVVLAGHLDTVPPNGNERAVIEGDVLRGLGSADMKGGLAVMLALAEHAAGAARFDLTFVFYESEEVADIYNGLRRLFAAEPELVQGDLAVLLEPTAGHIEAGCQGTVRLSAVFRGQRAHTARSWLGVNAVHRAAPVLARLAEVGAGMGPVVVDGLEYREGLQVVEVRGGVAGNVVPDECSIVVNRRFAPSVALEDAISETRALLEGADEIEVVDAASAAHPNLDDPLLAELVTGLGTSVLPKLGWTDVARFAEHGIPALNFGPGDPELAHTAAEHVTRQSLDTCHATLRTFLAG